MVGALLLAMTSWRRLQPGSPDLHVAGGFDASGGSNRGSSQPKRRQSSETFKGKLEERWKRRWDERGGEGR